MFIHWSVRHAIVSVSSKNKKGVVDRGRLPTVDSARGRGTVEK